MRVIGIAGFKNSGKTTLVVELIRELTGRGVRVATLKHAHHDFDIDKPGKDSYKHREAGASEVIVSSARRWAHIGELRDSRNTAANSDEPEVNDLLRKFGDVDLVLIEGYKHGQHPKLEVRRKNLGHPELSDDHAAVIGIVSDYPIPETKLPVLIRDDVSTIADFVLEAAQELP